MFCVAMLPVFARSCYGEHPLFPVQDLSCPEQQPPDQAFSAASKGVTSKRLPRAISSSV